MFKAIGGKIKNRKKPRFSKPIVAIIIGLNFWFTNKVLNIYLEVGAEPAVLIGAWFAFTTGELWLLSRIRRDEIRKEDSDDKICEENELKED